jgi:hypothetical protein
VGKWREVVEVVEVRLPARRGSKKVEALRKCLEIFRRKREFTRSELVTLLIRAGLSSTYSERVVTELAALGIIKKRDRYYEVDLNLLEKLLREV